MPLIAKSAERSIIFVQAKLDARSGDADRRRT
jgi:hypothetical protein